MSVASAKKIEEISRAANPKLAIFAAVGDLNAVEVLSDLVLIGTYIRPEKNERGILLPIEHLREDEFQGKAGLVLKTGPLACAEWEDEQARGMNAQVGTWVVCAVKDGWPVQINGTPCRLVPYDKIRLRVADPNIIY